MNIKAILCLLTSWCFIAVSGQQNATQIISSNGLNTFVSLLTATGRTEALAGDKPLTVFAPSDKAFAKLPEGVLEWLLKEKKETISFIVGYHIIKGKQPSSKLRGGSMHVQNSIVGKTLVVTNKPTHKVNGVPIVRSDVLASNGVLHIIDEILLPPHFSDLPVGFFGKATAAATDSFITAQGAAEASSFA